MMESWQLCSNDLLALECIIEKEGQAKNRKQTGQRKLVISFSLLLALEIKDWYLQYYAELNHIPNGDLQIHSNCDST